METIKRMSEVYARKAYFASGVNPNFIESVIYEALTEFKSTFTKEQSNKVRDLKLESLKDSIMMRDRMLIIRDKIIQDLNNQIEELKKVLNEK